MNPTQPTLRDYVQHNNAHGGHYQITFVVDDSDVVMTMAFWREASILEGMRAKPVISVRLPGDSPISIEHFVNDLGILDGLTGG